jgi:hypothetical protein
MLLAAREHPRPRQAVWRSTVDSNHRCHGNRELPHSAGGKTECRAMGFLEIDTLTVDER